MAAESKRVNAADTLTLPIAAQVKHVRKEVKHVGRRANAELNHFRAKTKPHAAVLKHVSVSRLNPMRPTRTKACQHVYYTVLKN